MATESVHYDVEVTGRVQGVGFRYSAVRIAENLGLKGFVKNTRYSSVELEIEGPRDLADAMLRWCETGPATGRVTAVNFSEGPLKDYTSFRIRY